MNITYDKYINLNENKVELLFLTVDELKELRIECLLHYKSLKEHYLHIDNLEDCKYHYEQLCKAIRCRINELGGTI